MTGRASSPDGGRSRASRGRAAAVATAIASVFLRLYPASFRREVGRDLVDDVGRHARTLAAAGGAPRVTIWLVRLTVSLLVNALGAWRSRLGSIAFSWLDLKLALRMLVKHPGLTITGGLGITVAIAIGVGFFAATSSYFYPVIPLSDGHRLVGLENWDLRTTREDRRALHDFVRWRAEMETVEDMSAFRTVTRNLFAAEGGNVELVRVAEITASGFDLARVPPLLGRPLRPDDEAADAAPVAVIGFDVWRTRFASAPDILGQELRLGATTHEIVGVMPADFGFPVDHRFWVPLKIEAGSLAPGDGPAIFVAARLVPDAGIADARAELEVIGARAATAYPETHEHLRPDVLPYTYPFAGMNRNSPDAALPANIMFTLILVVVCANVGILVYARTVTRRGEIAVRTALGARRLRIVAQLFAEALVLAGAAAALGLLLVDIGLDWARAQVEAFGNGAFWSDYSMPGSAVVYVGALALLAALITGVVPGLHATGGQARATLAQLSGGGTPRLGRTWTALLILQVALAVAVLPLAAAGAWFQIRDVWVPAFPAEEVLFAEMRLGPSESREHDATPREAVERFAALQREVAHRLDQEPNVVSHAYNLGTPGAGVPARVTIADAGSGADGTSHRVERSTVDVGYFQTLDVDLLAGRVFHEDDHAMSSGDAVVVNRAFADRLLPSGDALGRRLRYATSGSTEPDDAEAPRFEIVGVVENILVNPFDESLIDPRVYHLVPRGESTEAAIVVRVDTQDHRPLAARIRQIAASLDPALQVDVVVLEQIYRFGQQGMLIVAVSLGVALLSVLLLSAAGIYALMSFTVAQRRREIAIRTALGARPGKLLRGIFHRALRQIATGVAIGAAVALLVDGAADGAVLQGHGTTALAVTVLIMGATGLAAALGPARRGLRVDPSEALKGE